MNIEELELGQRWRARLVENKTLTPPGAREEVRELVLEMPEPGKPLHAGQSVAVLVPGPHGFGQNFHIRLYTVAQTPAEAGPRRFSICVRRCSFLDPYSGERFPGIASNYLCDLPVDSEVLLGGPVGLPFVLPEDPAAPLLIVGLGTGIAPFRDLVRELYEERHWQGKVMLFHGAQAGLETVYRDAMAAFSKGAPGLARVEVRSPRPAWNDPADLAEAVRRHQAEVWELIQQPGVHVYMAGLEYVAGQFDAALAEAAGDAETWEQRKAELVDSGQWMSLLY